MVGKNGRYLIGDFGCKVCLGYLVTDAPLQGDDYRDTQVVLTNPCQNCTVCLDVCPTQAILPGHIDQDKCLEGCLACMEHCLASQIRWEKLPCGEL
ncbi:MAG: hypothetical protein PHI41_07430 [Erysipelotrichaceae bacterium]|nr:hypothetical protein [Erysipelotrichaceae bacterium]MDD3809323.1 hypothetical protein [Erysipelotrichaceae bacterium]